MSSGLNVGNKSDFIAILQITAHNQRHENNLYNPTHESGQMLLEWLLIKALLHGFCFLKYALIFDHIFSIGFKSGLYGGNYKYWI